MVDLARVDSKNLPPPPILAVAYSGGADSTALLLETWRNHPKQTIAFHVHHGIQAVADHFVQHCQTFCDSLSIPLHIAYINAKHQVGESPEEVARTARYAALQNLALAHGVAASNGKVLVAHHADDQIETLLLALSRGSGLGGLSCMRPHWSKEGVQFERPWLKRSALDIRNQLQDEGISFIEDPSNANKVFTRNKIRHEVLPAILRTFPGARATFLRSIEHLASGHQLLQQYAQLDLNLVGIPPQVKTLQTLTPERQSNCLRYWLKSQYSVIPSSAQLRELLKQIATCRTGGHRIWLKVATGIVSLDQWQLRYNQ